MAISNVIFLHQKTDGILVKPTYKNNMGGFYQTQSALQDEAVKFEVNNLNPFFLERVNMEFVYVDGQKDRTIYYNYNNDAIEDSEKSFSFNISAELEFSEGTAPTGGINYFSFRTNNVSTAIFYYGKIIFSLKDTTNTSWADGTKGPYELPWFVLNYNTSFSSLSFANIQRICKMRQQNMIPDSTWSELIDSSVGKVFSRAKGHDGTGNQLVHSLPVLPFVGPAPDLNRSLTMYTKLIGNELEGKGVLTFTLAYAYPLSHITIDMTYITSDIYNLYDEDYDETTVSRSSLFTNNNEDSSASSIFDLWEKRFNASEGGTIFTTNDINLINYIYPVQQRYSKKNNPNVLQTSSYKKFWIPSEAQLGCDIRGGSYAEWSAHPDWQSGNDDFYNRFVILPQEKRVGSAMAPIQTSDLFCTRSYPLSTNDKVIAINRISSSTKADWVKQIDLSTEVYPLIFFCIG